MPPLKECILYVKYFKYVSFFQANFEAMFREYESNATFHYLRSFRRVRVDFEAHLAASRAKLELDGTPLGDNVIHCYFLQVSIYYKSISAKKMNFYVKRIYKFLNGFNKFVLHFLTIISFQQKLIGKKNEKNITFNLPSIL